MNYLWTDIQDIVCELADKHPDVDPQYVRFTDLDGFVNYLILRMILKRAMRKFSRPFRWLG